MAKRSSDGRNSERVKPKGVQLRLLVNTKLKIPGSVSKKQYVFNGAGSMVTVAAEDVLKLMERTRPGSCCGGAPGPTPVFEIVD